MVLATNQERHRTRHLLEAVGLSTKVDGEFASCSVGHRKPFSEYLAEVARRLGFAPERIVFSDDAERNVAVSRAMRWMPHLDQGIEGFERTAAFL